MSWYGEQGTDDMCAVSNVQYTPSRSFSVPELSGSVIVASDVVQLGRDNWPSTHRSDWQFQTPEDWQRHTQSQ